MKTIERKFVRIKDLVDKLGFKYEKRALTSKNKFREVKNSLARIYNRRKSIGFDLNPIFWEDPHTWGFERFLIDEVSAQVFLLYKGLKPKKVIPEAKKKYAKLLEIQEKSKKLTGKVWRFIKTNQVKIWKKK